MKRKDKENLKNMSVDELEAHLRDLEKKLFQIKFKRVAAPLENPLVIRSIRKEMSMVRTWLKEKELDKDKAKAEVTVND
ncbi:MAG: 50S ribosomal protein L29 [Elusimicrobiales bacterium]|nr:50S ribosomal protein L29 [Elusimicrobiales bacterium]MCK5106206.1 50S ribosomal protein L29 [Elusimicrobiales bacterium]